MTRDYAWLGPFFLMTLYHFTQSVAVVNIVLSKYLFWFWCQTFVSETNDSSTCVQISTTALYDIFLLSNCIYAAKKKYLQHTCTVFCSVFFFFFLFLFISSNIVTVWNAYYAFVWSLIHWICIYRKSMGVEIFHLTFWHWNGTFKGQVH